MRKSQFLEWLRQCQAQTVAQNGRASPPNVVLNLTPRIAAAEVRQHDQVILETLGKVGDVIEVDVPVLLRTALVTVRDKRALDHQHFRFVQTFARLENAAIGVAGVEQERLFVFVRDRHSIVPQPRELAGRDAAAAVARAGAAVVALGGCAQALNGVLFWNVPLLFATGRAVVVGAIAVAGTVMQVAALLLLVPGMQATGAALAFALTQVFANGAATPLAVRTLRPASHSR
jgi:hypothetical protein